MICIKEKKVKQGRGIGSIQGRLKFCWLRNLSDFSEKVTFKEVREQAVLLIGGRTF